MPNRILTPITEVDFEGIKTNLKNYLSATPEFTDYDFEGSGMSILLDILAYNTHYTAMYANMLASESFLESAVLRKSIVNLAKNLGYVPSSDSASRATVSLTFGITAAENTLPIGTSFTATKDGVQYLFLTKDSYPIDKTSYPNKCENIEIYQGTYTSSSMVYDPDSNSTKMELPFGNVDSSTIKLFVLKSPVDLSNADLSWKPNTDFLSLDPTSKVYFLQENHKGNIEISFGDGILGATPEKGNYIVATYIITESELANGISDFEFGGINGNQYDATVTALAPSAHGGPRENELSIKYTAPKYYQAQDRAVTVNDYESIIMREYNNAYKVRVWGGEDNDPPQYGKVFLSIIPKNSELLTDVEKQTIIRNILDKKKIVSVKAEIVDPDYTYVLIECSATFDSSRSFINEFQVKSSIVAAINTYSLISLSVFASPLRYSILSRQIDLSNNSMVSNRISTRLAKKLVPKYGTSNYTLDFGVKLQHDSTFRGSIVSTSVFKHRNEDNVVLDCLIEDNGKGILVMKSVQGSTLKTVNPEIGTIDYETGRVDLNRFSPTGTGTKSYIQFNVIPDQSIDIVPKRNQILKIDSTLDNGIVVKLFDSSARKI